MPNQISRRTLLAALAAAVPSAALARVAGAQTAPATPPPPAPITGPQIALPPTELKAPYPRLARSNRLDPRLDVLIDADAKVEKVCDWLPARRRAGVGWRRQRLPAGLRHPGQPHRQMVAERRALDLAGAFGL